MHASRRQEVGCHRGKLRLRDHRRSWPRVVSLMKIKSTLRFARRVEGPPTHWYQGKVALTFHPLHSDGLENLGLVSKTFEPLALEGTNRHTHVTDVHCVQNCRGLHDVA